MSEDSFQNGHPTPDSPVPPVSGLRPVDADAAAGPVDEPAGLVDEAAGQAHGDDEHHDQRSDAVNDPVAGGGDSVADPAPGQVSPEPKEPAETAEKKKPRILWSNQSLSMVEPDVLEAIRVGNSPKTVFQSGGKLVRLHACSYGVHLGPLTVDSMRYHMDRWMTFTRKSSLGKGKQANLPIPAPLDVVRDLLAKPSWDEDVFPTIERISTVPFFTSNGTLVQKPGYSEAARVWYEPCGLVVQPVSPDPSEDEVEKAKNLLLDDYLSDFRFEDQADKANALAYLITPFIREMVDLVPMLILDAPTPGTGKGLCLKCIACVALGTVPAMKPQPENEPEWRKALTALLVDLPTFIILDNLAGTLKSDSLCAMLTSEVWCDRELGSTRTVRVPIRCVPMGTANNLEVAGDIPRRLVWSRLDTKLERPDERKPEEFKHPHILTWAKEHRGELVHAVLVLVQAWVTRGSKPGTQTMGSYETWAQTVGGILDVAGVPGFLANAAKKRERADGDAAEWKAFCQEWYEEHALGIVGVKNLYDLAVEKQLLPWITSAETEQGGRQKLGHALVKRLGRCFGNHRIVEAEREARSGARQYKLETVSGSTMNTPSGNAQPSKEESERKMLQMLNDDCDPQSKMKPLQGILSPEAASIVQQVYDLEMRMRPVVKEAYDQLRENKGSSSVTYKYDTIRDLQEVVGKLADDVERQFQPNIEDELDA